MPGNRKTDAHLRILTILRWRCPASFPGFWLVCLRRTEQEDGSPGQIGLRLRSIFWIMEDLRIIGDRIMKELRGLGVLPSGFLLDVTPPSGSPSLFMQKSLHTPASSGSPG